MRKKPKRLVAIFLTLAMVLSLSVTSVFAYSSDVYSEYAPDEVMEVDKGILSGSTAAANTTAMSILGINVTSTDVPGVVGNVDDPLNLLVFGSDLNENPDPYLWNFYYNFNKNGETYPNKDESDRGSNDDDEDDEEETENEKLLKTKDIYNMDAYEDWVGSYTLLNYAKAGPTGAATTEGVIPIQVNSTKSTLCNPLFYYEPNILMGGSAGGYTVGLDYYKSEVNSSYDPLEVYGWGTSEALGQYAINTGTIDSTFAMANGVYTMAKEIQDYLDENNIDKESRYNDGSVLQCGIDYSNFALGIYYFLQSRLNPITSLVSQISKATYCTGISITDSGKITVTNDYEKNLFGDENDRTVNPITRYLQYLDGIADYVEADPDTVYNNYYELKQDVDMIIMDTSTLTANQKRMINHVNIKLVDISSIMPNTVYGTTMQSADNILGLPYFVGLLYEGKLSSYSYGLSEYDYTAYFVKNIYHVEGDDNVKAVLTEMFREGGGNAYVPYEDKGLTNNYEYYINSMIEIGVWYYTQTELGSGNWQAIDDIYSDTEGGDLGD